MPSILLVEDDQTIRLTVEFALTKAGYAVTTAPDGKTALEYAETTNPNLILLDLMLPKVSGIDVARTLRAHNNTVPIIMLTALDREKDKIRGLDAGADDYITKPFSTDELLARIRANMRRAGISTSKRTGKIEAGELSIDLDAARVTVAGEPVTLRSKEYKVLVALASRPGALATRQWLALEVWGEEFLSTSRTIDTHIRRIRKAIDRNGWTYIQTAHGMGYRFEPTKKE
ncbi:MAG: response regulator transcription factor [Eggerthellaceae bacterium]|jgi:DNA-binding response OmpR family regulator